MKQAIFKSTIVISMSLLANAHAEQCPVIAGTYEAEAPPQIDVKQTPGAEVSGWSFVGDTGILDLANSGTKDFHFTDTKNSTKNADQINLGREYVSFILDGQEHVWDQDASADNYFRKYTGTCTAGKITIEESGSNNDRSSKRVDTYHSMTTLEVKGESLISYKRTGEMLDRSGQVVVTGTEAVNLVRR